MIGVLLTPFKATVDKFTGRDGRPDRRASGHESEIGCTEWKSFNNIPEHGEKEQAGHQRRKTCIGLARGSLNSPSF